MNNQDKYRQLFQESYSWLKAQEKTDGWAAEFSYDARIAMGLIQPETVACGGRGLENMHLWPSWDVMGDWTTRCIAVENWLDVPLSSEIEASK